MRRQSFWIVFATVGLIVRVMRGRGVVPDKFNRLCLPEFIAGQPAYVSFQSTLSYHGMIDQIPSAVYGITCGRGGVVDTPTDIGWLKIATPEKAQVDILYLRMTSLGDFKQLPAVALPSHFKSANSAT